MPVEHLHLEGAVVDHPEWMADERDDVFDAAALERAMLESRRHAYAELQELTPAQPIRHTRDLCTASWRCTVASGDDAPVHLFAIECPSVDAEVVADRCWQAGAAGIWEQAEPGGVVLRVGVEDGEVETFLEALADRAPRDVTTTDAVELASRTVTVGPAEDPVTLEVPGTVFGDGLHPTTAACLDVIGRVVGPGTRVLDVGCGSGALSVVAARAGAEVTAIDIDPVAVEATVANAAANGVVVDASATPLADLDGSWDVVFANISAQAIVELATELWRVLAPGGTLVVSGILAERWDEVQAALGGTVQEAHDVDGWITASVTRS